MSNINLDEKLKYYKATAISIAVVKHNGLIHNYTRGFPSYDITRAINNETLFQAASVSKSLNAIGAMKLVEEGKIALDDNINVYLDWMPLQSSDFKEKITLRRLLSHTAGLNVSGFPGYSRGEVIPSTLQVLNGEKPYVNTDPLTVIYEPGTKFSYSGGGSTVVQFLIEKITREDYATWMKKNVLDPLGMINSSFSQQQETDNIAFGHLNDKMIEGKLHIYPELAAAGLWTTTEDLAKFIIFTNEVLSGNDHKVLKIASLKEMIKPHAKIDENSSVGLGFFLTNQDENFRFWHTGGNEGFSSVFVSFPKTRNGYAILVNSDEGFDLSKELGSHIEKENFSLKFIAG